MEKIATGTAAMSCSDIIRVILKAQDNVIVDFSYEEVLCESGVKAAEFIRKWIINKSIDEVEALDISFLEKNVGKPETIMDRRCYLLVITAIRNALAKLQG